MGMASHRCERSNRVHLRIGLAANDMPACRTDARDPCSGIRCTSDPWESCCEVEAPSASSSGAPRICGPPSCEPVHGPAFPRHHTVHAVLAWHWRFLNCLSEPHAEIIRISRNRPVFSSYDRHTLERTRGRFAAASVCSGACTGFVASAAPPSLLGPYSCPVCHHRLARLEEPSCPSTSTIPSILRAASVSGVDPTARHTPPTATLTPHWKAHRSASLICSPQPRTGHPAR